MHRNYEYFLVNICENVSHIFVETYFQSGISVSVIIGYLLMLVIEISVNFNISASLFGCDIASAFVSVIASCQQTCCRLVVKTCYSQASQAC